MATTAAAGGAAAADRPVSSFSPWNQIVRGELEPIAVSPASDSLAASSSSSSPPEEKESSLDSGNAGGKKPAWNKPSNNNSAGEVGSVMGAAEAWPALSEAARVSSNKSSSDSVKSLLSSDGSSLSVSQGTGTASSGQKQVSSNASSNTAAPHHMLPGRQRSMKRNGHNSSTNGTLPNPPASQGPVTVPSNNPSSRDHSQRSEPVSQPHSGNIQQPRNSFRNRNIGPNPRGDVTYHQNYGGRRNQDHGNQDWHPHRNYNGRGVHMHPQRGFPGGFTRHPPPLVPPPPPPNSTQFIASPHVQPFGGPMVFPELASPLYFPAPPPDSIRGVPLVGPMPHPPLFVPVPDPLLYASVANQVHYYFSTENLIKDTFLRKHMDDEGWVPVSLIAGFKRISELTDNIQLILDAVRSSTVVEVQGYYIRKRVDWMKWILPASLRLSTASSPQPMRDAGQDTLVGHVQSISLDESASDHMRANSQDDAQNKPLSSGSSSGNSNIQSQAPNVEGAAQDSMQEGSARAASRTSSN